MIECMVKEGEWKAVKKEMIFNALLSSACS